ncbi:MAG: hypothetical protein K9J06_14525 [Flavobacteriales bacterium]|nr:hypothetical protein [Flavobacteriales bacterium]
MINEIDTLAEVRAFVTYLICEEGIDFHPDIPFDIYVNDNTGEPLYNEEEVFLRDRLLMECLELSEELDVDTRALMMAIAAELKAAKG